MKFILGTIIAMLGIFLAAFLWIGVTIITIIFSIVGGLFQIVLTLGLIYFVTTILFRVLLSNYWPQYPFLKNYNLIESNI